MDTTTMLYKMMLHESEEGYSVSCPSLPGCCSQGETEEEAIENIQEAISEYKAVAAELYHEADMREIEVAA